MNGMLVLFLTNFIYNKPAIKDQIKDDYPIYHKKYTKNNLNSQKNS